MIPFREQFETLVNFAVVTNVVPYIVCILASTYNDAYGWLGSESHIAHYVLVQALSTVYMLSTHVALMLW